MRTFILTACLLLSVLHAAPVARAAAPETRDSVVSVLPVWPGRAQGGAGAQPGVAPEGSGVVIGDGVVATAWHVIEPAQRIDVRLADGRILPARLIAQDAATDIALLEVAADLPVFTLAPEPEVFDPVCAIGNAFGLGLSVSCGVVSATRVSNAGFNPVEDFVQTDAAINPGVSGGALVDAEGRLVGLVSAIFASEADSNIGINFAVSTELLSRVTKALTEDGRFEVPNPGWRLAMPGREVLARVAAPVVADLAPDGPAQNAGVLPGDLVLEVGPRQVRTPRDVIAALAVLDPEADSIDLVIERQGTRRALALPMSAPAVAPAQSVTEPLGDCPHPVDVCVTRQAVFPISSFDPVGSATRIGPDLLVTNRHVVGDRTDAVVHTPAGPRGARVVPSDYLGDLVLLHVPGLPEDGYVPELGERSLDTGPFYVVGADITREEVRVFDPGGLISGPAPEAALGRIHVYARMQPGVSGGAVVDAAGQLTGIAVGGGDGRFEVIPLADVTALVAGQDAPDADDVTRTLGNAFATCTLALERGDTNGLAEPALRALTDICAQADNHGQLLQAGRLMARAGAYDQAVALHGAAVAQVPNSINARISLLVSLQLGARFEDMIPHARWLMEKASDDPQALRFSIQSGVWGGDPELAEQGYAALLKADPVQAQAARRFIDNAPPAPPRR